jgi:putative nucleotidyltransferase with HDIG domain/diguanylate cyclase (GGDEF)-like protein
MPPRTFRALPSSTRLYLAIIIATGSATILLSLNDLLQGRINLNWLMLAALTLLSGSATVRLASIPVAISISETFVFTSALLFGASAGTLTVALDAAVISFWSYRRGQAFFKIAFNICALPLTIWVAAHLFFAIAGIRPLFRSPDPVAPSTLIVPLIVFTVVYFGLSSWIITLAIALERHTPAIKIWRENFLWIAWNYFGGASVALLLVSFSRDLNIAFLVIVVPLLAVLYATYSVTIGRVEDSNKHLTELNSLYMSTIETLAMAIDAKDQVTHGHIRRVQSYAVGLARKIGVTDPPLIRAIEAAALLHDMGKLAVPEYILNKPGPLTPSEFEKMKLHASVGADILSSIKFPYPVVPIVRHHHENWDGRGYPDGLRGTEIPIGARILSVVDCFDALTSDRPYRPRLSDADAIKILTERRGTMYDPLIVDTFVSIYKEITPDTPDVDNSRQGLAAITRVALPVEDVAPVVSGLDDIASSTEEMLVLYELARGLTGRLELGDAADIISKHLRRIVPASTCVFFVYETDKDQLIARHAAGDNASHFIGLQIARGERLSGWVAANRRSILNSDPVLDLGETARSIKPRLRSCLSTPLINNNQLVGVLSVYSPQAKGFADDHRRLLEVIARQVSQVVQSALEFERDRATRLQDQLTGLPKSHRLQPIVSSEIESPSGPEVLSIILVELTISDFGLSQGVVDAELSDLVASTKRALRGADVLSRYSDTQLLVLLTQTDAQAAFLVASRIGDRISSDRKSKDTEVHSSVYLGSATAPRDGRSLDELVGAARVNLKVVTSISSSAPPSVH